MNYISANAPFGRQRAYTKLACRKRGEDNKAAAGERQQMSYEMMEALLVQKIAGLRESEAMFARSLRSAANGSRGTDLNAVQLNLNAQIHDVEQLLAAMDAAPAVPAMMPIDVATQMTPSAWM
jgi:hypothetical protein